MSEAIQRYDLEQGSGWDYGGAMLLEAVDGDWVKYEAVAKLEAEHNKELARWQHDIYNYLCCVIGEPLYRIDGGACDSGDPLDFTLMEIKQCVEILKENADAEIAALREQLAAPQWRPITEQDLPSWDDEMICMESIPGNQSRFGEIVGFRFFADPEEAETFESITVYGWTHFRPHNAPPAKP